MAKTTKSQKNVRLPLIGEQTNRTATTTKDQKYINIFPETIKIPAIESTKIFLNKRPGLTLYKQFGSGEGRGVAWFNDAFYIAVGDTIWKDGVTPTAIITMTTTTGKVGMLLGNSTTIGDYLFICDGTDGWVINNVGTVLPITDDSLSRATVTLGGTGFTNGTYTLVFTGGDGTGATGTYTCLSGSVSSISITNGGSGYTVAPTLSFPSGGGSGATGIVYINAFPTPHIPTPAFIDGYVVLAQRSDVYTCDLDEPTSWNTSNYLSAEMFPDSVIALARQNNNVLVFGVYSTEFFYDAANTNGSPLARNDASTAQVGCISPNAIHQNEKQCFFVGQSDMGGRAVWQNVGFEMKKVSTEFIDRIIDAETNLVNATGYGLRTMGHLFYVINLPTVNKTIVYDSEEKLWHQWSSDVSGIQNVFNCNYTADNNTGTSYLLSATGGKLYNFNVNSYQDDTTPILVELQTGKFDMDTYKRKFLVNFRIVGDETPGNYVNVKWTDDDYQTWSNTKQIGLDDSFPNFARGGAFRRRALNIQHNLNLPLRLESFETTYYEGDS